MSEKTVRVKLTCGRAGHNVQEHPVLGPDGKQLYDQRTGQPRVDRQVVGYWAQAAGDEVEMPADEAQRHVERGLAVAVREPMAGMGGERKK
jgi:hypothetical protein